MKKERMKTSPVWQISEEKFKNIVFKSHTYKEMLEELHLDHSTGGNYKTLKARILKEQIDVSFLKERRRGILTKNLSKTRRPLDEILVENSTMTRAWVKKRLIENNLLKEVCCECGLSKIWNGKPINLQLEHKNGINDDNRLDNLCLLCPNCHSQTKTYAGKKNRKKYRCKDCFSNITKNSKSNLCRNCVNKSIRKVENRPSREELLKLILSMSFVDIGKKYGVSDTAIKKWCRLEKLPRTSREIKDYKNKNILIKNLNNK